jgi:hypothetical protein
MGRNSALLSSVIIRENEHSVHYILVLRYLRLIDAVVFVREAWEGSDASSSRSEWHIVFGVLGSTSISAYGRIGPDSELGNRLSQWTTVTGWSLFSKCAKL